MKKFEININKVEIEKTKNNFYILKYEQKYLYKELNPLTWSIVDEPIQLYTSLKFAENDLKSLKKYINKK